MNKNFVTVKQQWLMSLDELTKLLAEHDVLPTQHHQMIMEMKQSLSGFKITVPLIGKFSSGKSSILNAWLGRNIQPEDLAPCTALATEIRYSDSGREYALIFRKSASSNELNIEEKSLSDYQNIFSNPNANYEDINHIQLFLSSPNLAKYPDIVLVDTPGIESTMGHHEKALERYLGDSNAYVLCVHAKNLLGEPERQFMLRQHLFGQEVFVLVCMEDLIASSDRINIHQSIASQSGIQSNFVYGSSANPNALDLSGFDSLLQYLDNSKLSILEKNFLQDIESLLKNSYRLISGHIKQYTSDDNLLEQEKEIKQKINKLHNNISQSKLKTDRLLPMISHKIADQVYFILEKHKDIYVSSILNKINVKSKMESDLDNAIKLSINQLLNPELSKIAGELATSNAYGSESIRVNHLLPQININNLDNINTVSNVIGSVIKLSKFVKSNPYTIIIGVVIDSVLGFLAKHIYKQQVESAINDYFIRINYLLYEQIPLMTEQLSNEFFMQLEHEIQNRLRIEEDNLLRIRELQKLNKEQQEQEQQKIKNILDEISKIQQQIIY